MAVLTSRALFDGAAIAAEKVQAIAKMKVENFMFAGLLMRMERVLVEIFCSKLGFLNLE